MANSSSKLGYFYLYLRPGQNNSFASLKVLNQESTELTNEFLSSWQISVRVRERESERERERVRVRERERERERESE